MTDGYWFWLTFPGGVVIGLTVLSPFLLAWGFWSWYKADKEKIEKAKIHERYMERLRNARQNQ